MHQERNLCWDIGITQIASQAKRTPAGGFGSALTCTAVSVSANRIPAFIDGIWIQIVASWMCVVFNFLRQATLERQKRQNGGVKDDAERNKIKET